MGATAAHNFLEPRRVESVAAVPGPEQWVESWWLPRLYPGGPLASPEGPIDPGSQLKSAAPDRKILQL